MNRADKKTDEGGKVIKLMYSEPGHPSSPRSTQNQIDVFQLSWNVKLRDV